jgi:hypothetical protein
MDPAFRDLGPALQEAGQGCLAKGDQFRARKVFEGILEPKGEGIGAPS